MYSPPLSTNITTATTTVVSSTKCRLVAVVINNTPAGTIEIYNNSAASVTKVATLPSSSPVGPWPYFGVYLVNGLTIVTGASCDLTVVWQPMS